MSTIKYYQEYINSFLRNLSVKKNCEFSKFILNFKNQMLTSKKLISSLFLISNGINFFCVTKFHLHKLLCILLFEYEFGMSENPKFKTFEFFKKNTNELFLKNNKLDNSIISEFLTKNKYLFFFQEFNLSGKLNKDIKQFIEESIDGEEDYVKLKLENIRLLKIPSSESYLTYIKNIINPLFELVFESKTLAVNFSHICMIEQGVSEILNEIIEKRNYTTNYWLNFGIRKTYEKYLNCKAKILTKLNVLESDNNYSHTSDSIDDKNFLNYVLPKKTNDIQLSEFYFGNDNTQQISLDNFYNFDENNKVYSGGDKNYIYRSILHDFDEKIEKFINMTNPDISSTIASLS